MPSRAPSARLRCEPLESRTNPVTLPDNFQVVPIVEGGLGFLTGFEYTPDGRILATDKTGDVVVVKDGVLLPDPAITVPVLDSVDRGLLGIAVDPAFAANGYVYLYYSAPSTVTATETVVSRFRMTGDTIDPASEVELLRVPTPNTNHVAGMIRFGPDGNLYISTGDNGFQSSAPRTDNLYGKILRINSDGTIPADNPFYATATGVNRAIYAVGFRNPFSMAFDPATGKLYVNDVGQNTWEEINDVVPGGNYGWPLREGPDGPDGPGLIDPVYAYGHPPDGDAAVDGLGVSIIAGAFYAPAGAGFPAEYAGKYFFADVTGGWIRTFDPATGAVAPFIYGLGDGTQRNTLIGLAVAADGALVFSFQEPTGVVSIRKVVYTPPATPPVFTLRPRPTTVDAGDPATFTAAATGTDPLEYQWRRNGEIIPGATASRYTLTTAAADTGAAFTVTVTNAAGSVTSDPVTLTVVVNTRPVAGLLSPAPTATFGLGRTYTFAGTGTDAEDGTLPDAAYKWDVFFVTGTVTRPYYSQTGGRTGSFSLPADTVYDDTDIALVFRLTVTDSDGATAQASVRLAPELAPVTVGTNIPGLRATTLGGQPFAGTVTGVVGYAREVGALPQAELGGEIYEFVAWSDGGAAEHAVVTPAEGFGVVARYRRVAPVAFGNGAGGLPMVRLEQTDDGSVSTFAAFEADFAGGVRVAVGDVTGDGVADVIAAAGPGGGPRVRVFDGRTLAVVADFFAFEESFLGGVFVAAADVDGDGTDDILISPDVGGGPRVRVLAGGGTFDRALADFFAIADPDYRGGTRLTTGDINGDGVADLAVGTSSDGPRVAVYDGKRLTAAGVGGTPPKLVADFFAFDPTLATGVTVALGDVDGDGYADLVTGPGPGGGPRVTVFAGKDFATGGANRGVLADFFADDETARAGVRAAVRRTDAAGTMTLFATAQNPDRPVNEFVWDAASGTFVTPAPGDETMALAGGPERAADPLAGWLDVYVG